MRFPDRLRFPALLTLVFAVTFGAVLVVRWPEGKPPAGPASIPAAPQAIQEWAPAPEVIPAAPVPVAPMVESEAANSDASLPLPAMRPAAPPEYAYPEADVP
jgi:hypothetical protein